jgi:hypothetical protein
MPTREDLHKLVDSIPEGAMEAAHRVLSQLQVWPPPSPPDIASMRKRMEDRRMEMRQRMEERQKGRRGLISGFGGGGNYDPARGTASSGTSGWEDENTFVAQTYRQHKGHELMVIERIRIDGQHLIYKHEVQGPGDNRDEREVVFEIQS